MAGTLHLIFKTHLDLGFTGTASQVRQRYHDHFIPMALETGEHFLAEDRGAPAFVWTTGSWLIWDHLETQSPQKVRRLERAIEAGIIAWHALPFTTHTEIASPPLLAEGIGIARELDARFGRRTRAAKMTDVPGHTLGAVEVMAAEGIEFLHLGVNSASPVPKVPPVFRWRAPSGAEIVVMYQSSYGSVAVPEGMADGIAFAHTNDNAGPQDVSRVIDGTDALALAHPDMRLRASTLDAFWTDLSRIRETLPVVTSEIGDTWIHGVGSAPRRLSRFLAAQRAFDAMEAAPRRAFGRTLLEVAEHTWGVDIKTYLRDDRAWDRHAFEAARRDDPRFAFVEAAWAEQDAIVDRALAHLPPVEAERVRAGFAPPPPAFRPADALGPHYRVGDWALEFDTGSGALIGIARDGATLLRAGDGIGNGGVGLFSYAQESYSADDISRYLDSYLTDRVRWAILDHAKPGLESARSQRSARFAPAGHRAGMDGDRLWIASRMPREAVEEFGAPEEVLLGIGAAGEALALELHLVGKAANRQPEAGFLSFGRAPGPLRLVKTGLPIDPADVVEDGNRQLHAVTRIEGPGEGGGRFALTPLDSPLFCVGAQPFLPHVRQAPEATDGGRFVLFNNKWGTNFSMWCEGDLSFRFELAFEGGAA